jgi:NADPH:quinone reductase
MRASPEMNAVLFDRAGDAAVVLRWGIAPLPEPGAGQVRVRVSVRVIQPADFLFIAGTYRVKPRFPQIAGFDGAGVIDAVGPDGDTALIGQRVAFRSPGAWAEYALAPLSRIFAVPDDVDDELACQFPLNPLTAWGLLDVAATRPGGRVLATAGSSVVARLIAALAVERGLAVTLVARADAGELGYRAWHPAAPAAAHAADLPSLLRQVAPEAGFDAVLDPVGGPSTTTLIAACAPGAALISYGVLDDQAFEIKASTLLYRNLRWQGFGIDGYLNRLSPDGLRAASAALWQLMRARPALLAPARRFALDQFALAIAGAPQSAKEGKTLLLGPGASTVH